MDVTVSEDRIEKLKLILELESQMLFSLRIPAEIIEGQTLNVDAVSGASNSNGVLTELNVVQQADATRCFTKQIKAPPALDKEDKTIRQMLPH